MATITDMSLTLCEAGTGKRESVKNWGKCHTRRRLVGKTQEVKDPISSEKRTLRCSLRTAINTIMYTIMLVFVV